MLPYIVLDLLILFFPLVMTFFWKVKYYRFFKPLFGSIAIVGGSYILWDVLVTLRQDWWFNKEFLLNIPHPLGLPIEEILFFVVVPYACIFIYENLVYFIRERTVNIPKWFFPIIAALLFVAGVYYRFQDYTILALWSVSTFLLIATVVRPKKTLQSSHYWLYIILSFIPFMIFNYLLTSTVIVFYNPDAIWGIRITTIPLEDFFYNFSMLSFYLLVYIILKERIFKIKSDTKSGI